MILRCGGVNRYIWDSEVALLTNQEGDRLGSRC